MPIAPCAQSIERSLNELKQAVSRARAITAKAEILFEEDKFSNQEVAGLYELSFLQVFCEFEVFLERAMIDFMLGACQANGAKPTRYFLPRDRDHAVKFLLQGKPFQQYGDTQWVRNTCELVFQSGSPINPGLNSSTRLGSMRDVRNRIAHRSEHSERQFSAVVIREFTAHPPEVQSPGDFLRKLETGGRWPVKMFERYMKEFLAVGDAIFGT